MPLPTRVLVRTILLELATKETEIEGDDFLLSQSLPSGLTALHPCFQPKVLRVFTRQAREHAYLGSIHTYVMAQCMPSFMHV